MGETRVDLQHLLEDIRDAYPGALEETIVTEIVANSLDSGASCVRFEPDPAAATLMVADNGSGMARRQLARYHDIASSTKARGEGIGFAGVGIKLGLLACEDVFTETRRDKSHVATSWRLAARHRAPWRWVPPEGLVTANGTAVRLKLRNPLSPLLETGFLEAVLHRHFQPLFDRSFDDLLVEHYPVGVTFEVGGRRLPWTSADPRRAMLVIRLGRRRKPSALGFLVRDDVELPEDQSGLAVSTLGKVIKRGWDWLGLSPAEGNRIGGLIEVPQLAEVLTLNKADFIRAGTRGGLYLACRKAIQEAVSAQLAAWGDAPEDSGEQARRRKTRPIERDLAAILTDLADDFPLVASLVERRSGGQKRLPMPVAGGTIGVMASGRIESDVESQEPLAATPPETVGDEPAANDRGPTEEADAPATKGIEWPLGKGKRRRSGRLGLSIQFESRPDDASMGRLVDSTVWINEAHPAWRRAVATRSEGYHLALTVALTLAPLAAEASGTHGFVTAFLARWGEAFDPPGRRRRREP